MSLRRNLHSYRPITDDASFVFQYPSPLDDGHVAVSRRRANGDGTAELVRMDPDTGAMEPLFDDPERHDLQARALQARVKPDGRSSVVNVKDPNGRLYCLNPYISDLEDPAWMAPGTIRRLRVLEGVPRRQGHEPAPGEPAPVSRA